MTDLTFLPKLPLAFSGLATFGLLLVLGLLAGEAARRYASVPRITGYAVVGALLGPHGSGLLSDNALYDLRLLVDLSIGLVVFELGWRLDLEWLRRNHWLFAAALAESVLSLAAIYCALAYFGFRPLLAATAAAIGAATSPAAVMMVSRELRSEGQVTERMILFTAVNTVFAYLVVALLLPFLHLEQKADWRMAVLHPLWMFLGAAASGYVASRLLVWLAQWVGKDADRQLVLLVSVVVLTVGVTHSLGFSVVVGLVTLGVLARNFDRRHALLPVRLESAQLFFVVLFVLAGASLEFDAMGAAAAAAVAAYVVLRFLGKALGLLLFGRLSGIPRGGAGLLALALTPMSGLAVVMVRDTTSFYPSFGRELAAIVLSAAAVLELLGPLATQYALRRAGEAHPDG